MISVCLLNRLPSWLIGLINWVDNVNWPLLRVSKLTFRALVLRLSLWRNDNTELHCYTLPPTQYHSFFRNLPPTFIYQVGWFVLSTFSLLLLCFLKDHSTLITLLSHTLDYQTFCRLTSSNDLCVLIAKYWSEFLVESKIHITKQSKVNNDTSLVLWLIFCTPSE